MTPEDLDGRTIAIAVSAQALDGFFETVIHHGTLRWEPPTLWLDRGHGIRPTAVKPEWLSRIRELEEDEVTPELLDAEVFLSLMSKPEVDDDEAEV